MVKEFDVSKVDKIGFDVDGTLYRKDIEYIPGHGSVQDSHDFFRFSAFDRLKNGQRANQVAEELVALYRKEMREGTLKDFVRSIPDQLKIEWAEIIAKHGGSNGKALMKGFGTDSTFLHEMLANIDFDFILAADPKLRQLIEKLKGKGYKLGILTTEVYDTVQKVMRILGLDLADFSINTGHPIPILTAENVEDKKPGAGVFEVN